MLSPTSSEKHRLWKPKQWQLNHVLLTKVVLSQYFWPSSWILLMASQSIKPIWPSASWAIDSELIRTTQIYPSQHKKYSQSKSKKWFTNSLVSAWSPPAIIYILFDFMSKTATSGFGGHLFWGSRIWPKYGAGYDCCPGSGIHQFKEYVDWERKWLELY